MIWGSVLRNIGTLSRGCTCLGSTTHVLHDSVGPTHPRYFKLRRFRGSVRMMVDTGVNDNKHSMGDMLPEKVDDGGYASGGCKSEDGKLSCGYSSFRGKRANMEDFYDVKLSKIDGKSVSLFGIFDGHGGSRAAEYLKQHLFENLVKHPQFFENTKLALSDTYKQTDMEFLDAEKDTFRDDGSTASTAVLVGNHLYVANVGDSRTVVSKSGKAIPLSEDHKPNRLDERKRIESAGGIIMWAGTWRVGGVLAMSRAFGNRMLKRFVVAEPEIQEQEVNEELEVLVLASDGLWDVVPNEDAVSIARVEEEAEAAARKLTETAFTRGSADNITCIVVKFHHDKPESVDPDPNPEPLKQSDIQQGSTNETLLGEDPYNKESDLLDQIKEDDHTNTKEPDLIQEEAKIEHENDVELEHGGMEAKIEHENHVELEHGGMEGSVISG